VVRLQQKVFLPSQGVLLPPGCPCWVYPPRGTGTHLKITHHLYHLLVTQPPGQAWAAAAALARDRHHLPACSFIQWHKRMKTASQEHSLPSFFCFILRLFFFFVVGFFFQIHNVSSGRKTLQNFTSLRRHEFTSQDPLDSLFDRPPPPSLFSPFRAVWLHGP